MAVAMAVQPVAAVPPPSPLTEYPVTLSPDWKGRTVAVTVSPVNNQVAFVATDNGGLFKTTNGGGSWSHVDAFPPHEMAGGGDGDVAIAPDNANIIIAAASEDSQQTNGGGIWRSVDGGNTWQKPATSDSPDVTCTAARHAFGIGITTLGNVYVGTPCGIAVSNDFGATWTHSDPTPGGSRQVNDVVAQPGGIVDICANDGHHRSTTFGGSWTSPDAGLPGCGSITVSPFESGVLFATTFGPTTCGSPAVTCVTFWEGDPDGSGGTTWTNMSNAPGAGANRPPFIKAHPATDGHANHFDVFFGNGVLTYRQHCVNSGGPGLRCPVFGESDAANPCPAGSTGDCGTVAACANAVDDDGDGIINEGCPAVGAAEKTGIKDSDPQCNDAGDDDGDGSVNDGCPVMIPYGTEFHHWFDQHDIAFDTSSPAGCPILLVGDGGIGKSTDCGATWPNAGNGLAALEVYEVTGTVHPASHTDVYFGTQDNLIWASPDNGVTWPNKEFYEGFFLQTPHSIGPDSYEITGVTCGPCFNFRKTQHFAADLGWPNPPGGGGNPFLIEPGQPGRYAQVSVPIPRVGPAAEAPAQCGNGLDEDSDGTADDGCLFLYITEPETGAECSNAVDDDGDGAVNDGCPSDGSPETGAQCHNAIDDDDGGAGPVNEGCSSLNSKEVGAECSNAVDDDNDGVVNDGCPKVGTNGEGGAQCLDAVDANEDGAPDAVNDGCPEVGVYARTGPALPALASGRLYVVGPPSAPTIYILRAGATTGISKITAISNGSAVISAADNGLTDVATIGVDPNNPLHLIAADRGSNPPRMMVSTDGGATWTPDPELTALVIDNGRLKFKFGGSTPQARIIAFDPTNGNRILVGTEDSGIIASLNGGQDWFRVQGSLRIPTITSFFFDEFNNVVWVSSYGRGLWKLAFPSTDLSITKTDFPDPVMAGQELFYTITVTNKGPNPATVEVLDTLPPQVQYIGNDLVPPLGCVEFAPESLRCNVGVLDPNGSISFMIKVRVRSNAAVGSGSTTIINTATVQSTDTVDPNLSNNTATATTFAEELADLKVTKICKPDGPLLAGQTGTCTIYVDNLGPSDARNVVMEDSILANGAFTIGTVTPSQGTCDPPSPSNVVHCDLGNLPAQSTSSPGRATITIDVRANEQMDINDVATAVSDTPDPDMSNNQAQESLSVTAVSDLALIKTGPAGAIAGTNLTYLLTVTNNGPSTAKNVVVQDNLPAEVTVVSVGGSGGATCNAGVPGDPFLPTTCSFGTLGPAPASATMTILVKVKPDTLGTIHNDARASSDTFDDNTNNNLASVSTNVTADADLAVVKAATPNPVVAGTPLSYQINVSNNGPSTAVNISLTDPLDGFLTLTSTSVTGGPGSCGIQTNTNTVQCQLGSLNPGESRVVFIYTNVSPSAPDGYAIPNTATVSSPTPDTGLGPNSATISTNVIARADLSILLTSDKNVYKPSTVIHYQITVKNNGPSDALNVLVTQILPPPKTGFYISNDAGCPAPSGTTFTCPLGTIAAGGTKTFQLNFMIRGNKGTITQTATVSSSTTDPNAANNSSTRVVTVK